MVFQLVATLVVSRLGLFLPAPVRLVDSVGGALFGAVVGARDRLAGCGRRPPAAFARAAEADPALGGPAPSGRGRPTAHCPPRAGALRSAPSDRGDSRREPPAAGPECRALAGGPPGCASSGEGLGNGVRAGSRGVRVGRRALARRHERARHRRRTRYPRPRAERQEPSRPARVRGRRERRRPAPGVIARCCAAPGGPCGGRLAPRRPARLSAERPARLRAWHRGFTQANRRIGRIRPRSAPTCRRAATRNDPARGQRRPRSRPPRTCRHDDVRRDAE